MTIWDEIINSCVQVNIGRNKETKNTCPEFGAICPQCGSEHLEYNGTLNLVCPECGYETAAGFT